MSQSDTTLHLWFKPYENVIGELDFSFIERYGKRFYPRALSQVAHEMHRLCASITRNMGADAFEYQMRHYTTNANRRYVIEESLRDLTDENGFSIGIQAANPEERKLFIESFPEVGGQTICKLPPVLHVIAYLEDALRTDAHKWENAKLHNGREAITVMQEIISFLNGVKQNVRVFDFSFNESEEGMRLSLALITPTVASYYVRLDWLIV